MKVQCPTCDSEVLWDASASYRPFCSKRCQLIDLGDWADENHSIAANQHNQDILPDNIKVEDIDVEDIEEFLAKQNSEQIFLK